MGDALEHETGEGKLMPTGPGGVQAFVGAGEPAEARRPGESARDDLAARQQDEAPPGLGQEARQSFKAMSAVARPCAGSRARSPS